MSPHAKLPAVADALASLSLPRFLGFLNSSRTLGLYGSGILDDV